MQRIMNTHSNIPSLKLRFLSSTMIGGLALCFLFTGCFSFDNPLVVEVPDYDPQLVVSCYLKPGDRYQLLLTESKSAYESVADTNAQINYLLEELLVKDALVTISHHGIVDTLDFRTDGHYWNDNVVPEDYEETYQLRVLSADGREVTGSTTVMPPVPVDSLIFLPNSIGSFGAVSYFTPPDDGEVHYFFQGAVAVKPEGWGPQDLFNTGLYNGITTPWVTEYNFVPGDSVVIRLIHIHPDHYEFIRTYDNAAEASFRPFSEPGPVAHTVSGGYGVFTGFDYDVYTQTIPE